MTSPAQVRLARKEGLLARQPNVAVLNWIAAGPVEAFAALALRNINKGSVP